MMEDDTSAFSRRFPLLEKQSQELSYPFRLVIPFATLVAGLKHFFFVTYMGVILSLKIVSIQHCSVSL